MLARLSIRQLVTVPALISLAITLVRVTGELHHWPKPWFAPESGILGITWLAPVFGIYFAIRLTATGEGPRSLPLALGLSLVGAAVLRGTFLLAGYLFRTPPGFEMRLLYVWTMWAVAGLLTLPGWPRLWKTLLAYGYAARAPVVIVMFFAFRGHWGTHYDAIPDDFTAAGLAAKWLWLGFFPQFIFWIGYTLASGMLFGSIAAAVMRLARARPGQAA